MRAGRPWLVFGIALLVAAVALLLRWPAAAPESPPAAVDDGGEASAPAGDPVRSYLEFADMLPSAAGAGQDVIVEGMRKLAGALGTLENVPADVPVDLRVAAEHIVLNPDAADTTAAVRDSLRAGAGMLDDRSPGAEPVAAVVDLIDAARPIAEQTDIVTRVFSACADRIRSLASAQ